jgi:predicted nucleic-acid-binding protein
MNPHKRRAAAFVRTQERVFVAKTVLLELEWVLRGAYRLTRGTIAGALRPILAGVLRRHARRLGAVMLAEL